MCHERATPVNVIPEPGLSPAGYSPGAWCSGSCDNALPLTRRIEIVEAKVAELAGLGGSVQRRTRHDDLDDPVYYVVMHDPEGNEFCVG